MCIICQGGKMEFIVSRPKESKFTLTLAVYRYIKIDTHLS